MEGQKMGFVISMVMVLIVCFAGACEARGNIHEDVSVIEYLICMKECLLADCTKLKALCFGPCNKACKKGGSFHPAAFGPAASSAAAAPGGDDN
ncbi:hypothetical protein ACP275_04G104000 [Erythranthe tilingii]